VVDAADVPRLHRSEITPSQLVTSLLFTKNTSHAMFSRQAVRTTSMLARRGFASTARAERSVAVLGAAGGIGQPMSLLLKADPLVTSLRLYDIRGAPGVAADISHVNTASDVKGFEQAECVAGAGSDRAMLMPASSPL
jgi:malate dehydrogenase